MIRSYLRDLGRAAIAGGCICFGIVASAAPIQIPGLIKFEAYTNITGTAVADLLAAPEFPDSPGATLYMSQFDTRSVYPTDAHDNFGARISGLITPTVSGDYEFFLRSDDAGQLFLSPDSDPANLVMVAEESTCCGAFEETGAPETSAPQSMVAGQSYAIQVLYKEGTGGDFAQVAWRLVGDPTPASSLGPIPGAFLSVMGEPQGSITLTKQPADATLAENDTLVLSVEFKWGPGPGPAVVQWQKDGQSLPGVTGPILRYGPLKASDNGAKFSALISTPGAVATSGEAKLTVTPDTTRPSIRSILGSDTFDRVTVTFSEGVTDASAGDATHYSLGGGLSVTEVTVLSPNSVRLGTSPQTPGTVYTLAIDHITDQAGLESAPGASKDFSAFSRVRGGLKFETYLNITGTAVNNLTSSPNYPGSPDVTAYVTQATSRLVYTDAATVENYGGRLSGWIVPPETAEYEFFIRSDDGGQLSLSTDEDPLNAIVIASEATCCGAFEEPGAPETSAPIALEAGKRYYIEALWKEGGGGDYCDVAWRKAGDTTLAAKFLPYIPGSVLETYAAPDAFTPPTVSFSAPSSGANFEVGSPVTISVAATAAGGKSITKVELFEQGQKVAEVTSSPFILPLYNLTSDNHSYVARATDSAGMFTDSAPLPISVGAEVESIALLAIDDKATWKYDRSGQDLGTDWSAPGFDDSAWPSGKALIADETTTTVEPIRTPINRFNDDGQYVVTFYFRTHFNFNRTVSPSVKLKLRHAVDDGAIFYLNGVEVHRFGLAEGPVTSTTLAASHENVYEGPFELPVDSLVQGDNVLAVEVHQTSTSSSDMVFGAELIATAPVIRTVLPVVAIDDKTNWKYDRSGQDLGTDWIAPAFDDSAWPSGKALIADETTTTVEPIRTPINRFNDDGQYVVTFFFRTHFNFSATSTARAKIKLRHAVDDGAIFYLNGTEIHRFGLPEGPVTITTVATSHENAWEGPFEIPVETLVLGDNVLAAEVHQTSTSSSDIVFGAELNINVPESDLVVSANAKLTIAQAGASLQIGWQPAGGTLQSSTSVAGPWVAVGNAANPFSASPSDQARFFRVIR